jgi:hypothetical protein
MLLLSGKIDQIHVKINISIGRKIGDIVDAFYPLLLLHLDNTVHQQDCFATIRKKDSFCIHIYPELFSSRGAKEIRIILRAEADVCSLPWPDICCASEGRHAPKVNVAGWSLSGTLVSHRNREGDRME